VQFFSLLVYSEFGHHMWDFKNRYWTVAFFPKIFSSHNYKPFVIVFAALWLKQAPLSLTELHLM
jgi:hypothetical protein